MFCTPAAINNRRRERPLLQVTMKSPHRLLLGPLLITFLASSTTSSTPSENGDECSAKEVPISSISDHSEYPTCKSLINGTMVNGRMVRCAYRNQNDNEDHDEDHKGDHDEDHSGIHLASWRWAEYEFHMTVTITFIFGTLINVYFHKIPYLSIFPESVFLIILGIILGAIMYATGINEEEETFFKLTPGLFFNCLLPPIILDAAFTLYSRDFLSNFFCIIVYAVLGTILNIFIVGGSLYGLASAGALAKFLPLTTLKEFQKGETHNWGATATTNDTVCTVETDLEPVQVINAFTLFSLTLPNTQALLFASLISAVDPVAVLAIFEEIQVNASLYFLVFGESLFNDGVSVVIYNSMLALVEMDEIDTKQYLYAFLSFFFVVFGGFFIGKQS